MKMGGGGGLGWNCIRTRSYIDFPPTRSIFDMNICSINKE